MKNLESDRPWFKACHPCTPIPFSNPVSSSMKWDRGNFFEIVVRTGWGDTCKVPRTMPALVQTLRQCILKGLLGLTGLACGRYRVWARVCNCLSSGAAPCSWRDLPAGDGRKGASAPAAGALHPGSTAVPRRSLGRLFCSSKKKVILWQCFKCLILLHCPVVTSPFLSLVDSVISKVVPAPEAKPAPSLSRPKTPPPAAAPAPVPVHVAPAPVPSPLLTQSAAAPALMPAPSPAISGAGTSKAPVRSVVTETVSTYVVRCLLFL